MKIINDMFYMLNKRVFCGPSRETVSPKILSITSTGRFWTITKPVSLYLHSFIPDILHITLKLLMRKITQYIFMTKSALN